MSDNNSDIGSIVTGDNVKVQSKRLIWVDWMKVIGMYFIIAGHISPVWHEYIYVFSVPLFFLVSGFLCKHEESNKMFWSKLYRNLILPCIIICIICMLYDVLAQYRLGLLRWNYVTQRVYNCLVGNQGRNSVFGGLGLCWFIYTLVICKILYQYTYASNLFKAIILVVCIIVAFVVNYYNIVIYNAIVNTSLAFPYFIGGGHNSVLP